MRSVHYLSQLKYSFWVLVVIYVQSIYAVTDTPARTSAKLPPLSMAHRINLEQAMNLAFQTALGKQFETDIKTLFARGQIHLAALANGHYGESGEGCIIRNGQYVYENLFIVLNETQSIPELASALIHEADHYQQIKQILAKPPTTGVKIATLEISAFAKQWEFIQQLEQLGLADRQALFVHDKTVFTLMAAAHAANLNPSAQTQATVLKQLQQFGYPSAELARFLTTKPEAQCQGPVNANLPNNFRGHP